VISARGLLQKDTPFSTQLSSVGTMVKVVNGKVQCRLCSKYPSCRWSPVCVAARGESKVNVMGGLTDSPSLLSDHPLRTSEYRLNLARSRETDRRHCHENRSPVFSYERSPSCIHCLVPNIMAWVTEYTRNPFFLYIRQLNLNAKALVATCSHPRVHHSLPCSYNYICCLCW